MLPAHRRPFADTPIDDLYGMLDDASLPAEIVIRADLATCRPDEPCAMVAMAISAFTTERLAMSAPNRVEGFNDHLVELAEHAAGLLRYDKSTDPDHYGVALKLDADGTSWHGFGIDRSGGAFSFKDRGVHTAKADGGTPTKAERDWAASCALSPHTGRPPDGAGTRKRAWQARFEGAEDEALEAMLGGGKRAGLVRKAMRLLLWLDSEEGERVLHDVQRTAVVMDTSPHLVSRFDADGIQGLIGKLRGGGNG